MSDQRLPRIQFILRIRDQIYYGGPTTTGDTSTTVRSSGLKNSASFVAEALRRDGFETDIVEVNDNNDIDRELTRFRPTHCIVEAFWVVPEKFDVLRKLHPMVTFCVRNHSEVPFMAVDGVSLGWTIAYTESGTRLSSNSLRASSDIRLLELVSTTKDLSEIRALTPYLPNIYVWPTTEIARPTPDPAVIRVGCFGAIRPLKNHVEQAFAAIDCAERRGVRLEFHINSTRVEQGGDPILKNMREMFKNIHRHKLIEHEWVSHDDFLALVATMDVVMQVSFTETFNIVAADAVAVGTPVIASSEVRWLDATYWARPTDRDSIASALDRALDSTITARSRSRTNLIEANAEALGIWRNWLLGT